MEMSFAKVLALLVQQAFITAPTLEVELIAFGWMMSGEVPTIVLCLFAFGDKAVLGC